MNIDRLLFLSFATSLSALACSASAPEESETDEGALVTLPNCAAPGADLARIVDSQMTFCADFADRAAAKDDHFASVYGQCMTLATRYKSTASEAAIACVKNGEARTDTWTNLYQCGYESLLAHCGGHERFEQKCKDLVQVASASRYNGTRGGSTQPDALMTECLGFLPALEASAVAEVEACVRTSGLPLYSCVEGLDASFKGRTCIDPGQSQRVPGLKETCDRIMSISSADEGILNRDTCLGIATRLRAAPANAFIERLNMLAEVGKPVGNYDVTQVAGKVIKDTCRNTNVDATCKQIVDGMKAAGISNNGGRLTKECRNILSAIDQKGGDQIKACSNIQKKLAKGSAAGLGRNISLYWCMSDLRAFPSEL